MRRCDDMQKRSAGLSRTRDGEKKLRGKPRRKRGNGLRRLLLLREV
jgi:hypothetical protein